MKFEATRSEPHPSCLNYRPNEEGNAMAKSKSSRSRNVKTSMAGKEHVEYPCDGLPAQ